MTVECEVMEAGEDGWSEWIHPLPGYLMQCCDCGLIHEMEFAIGHPDSEEGPLNDGETRTSVVIFRARRYEDLEFRQSDPARDSTTDPCTSEL